MTIEPNSIHFGDCLDIMPAIPDESVDAIITDPPYEINFMSRHWDKSGIAFNTQVWTECLRVLKPGGYLLCFTGTRTGHRVACAIEDAGFIIRDEIVWVYREGLTKSMDISKAIDVAAGVKRERIVEQKGKSGSLSGPRINVIDAGNPITKAARQWEGYGTGIKPAHENIILCMKPLSEKTFVENILKYGTGALNIDGCRIPTDNPKRKRLPANVVVTDDALNEGKRTRSSGDHVRKEDKSNGIYGKYLPCDTYGYDDDGSPSRYFDIDRWYKSVVQFPKASQAERHAGCEGLEKSGSEITGRKPDSAGIKNPRAGTGRSGAGNFHPTVKPIALLAWLVNLVARPGCLVLDPFGGSGSTAIACIQSQVDYILIEKEKDYVKIARKRIKAEMEQPWLIDLRKEVKN